MLIVEQGTPIRFYPYTHGTQRNIFRVNCMDKGREFNDLFYNDMGSLLIKRFCEAGIKCHRDNKIVFEVKYSGMSFYIGFYDWCLSIGLYVYGDSIHEAPF